MEIFDDEETHVLGRLDILKKHGFENEFENLAFEGGGAKMIAYTGTILVLEELGILKNVKRLAGTSGGAIAATLLSVGMSALEIKSLIQELPMEKIMFDSGVGFGTGYLTFLPNMLRKYGWNPGNCFHEEIRRILKKRTGDPDITFQQIYDKYKKELCVTSTNITTCSVEYFHPKTSPDMPVALAVKCSVCLPVLMQPVEIKGQLYVDGGVLCNYPLHVFDGWAMSMEENHSFFHKLGEQHPFGTAKTANPKTLGVLLYTIWEQELLKSQLYHMGKKSGMKAKRPDTTLARERGEECDRLEKEYEEELDMVGACKRFLDILRLPQVHHDEHCAEFTRDQWEKAVKELSKHPDDMKLLFGDMDVNQAWEELKSNSTGEMITTRDFVSNLQKRGIRFKQMLYGGTRYCPKNVIEFYLGLMNTTMNMSRKVHFKPADEYRTIGIFTDYINTADFEVEPDDIAFLLKQGAIGAVAFLEHYIIMKSQKPDVLEKHNYI